MLTPKQKLRIFLCHASQDKPVVRELFQRLSDEGWIDPWFDESKLLPGEDWRTSIEEAVEAADLVIICLSSNSITKEGFIQKELRYAREISLEKPEGTTFLIPVRLDMCDVPRGLRFIQWTDYFGKQKEQSYSSLLETFSNRYKQIEHDKEKQSLTKKSDITIKDPQPITQVLSDYYDQLDDKAKHPEENYSVPTGFIDLDRMTFGFQPSSLSLVASRSSQSKTSFLLSIAKNAALTFKKRVAIFSCLGMSSQQIVQLLIAQETGIDFQRLRANLLEESEWPLITYAFETISSSHLFLDDTPAITLRQLREKSRRLALDEQLDLIIVDNLQFIRDETSTINSPKDLDYISLKILSHELKVPLLTGVQLPRKGEQRIDKRPQLSDLHDFGSLEDSADLIMFIYQPDLYEVDAVKHNVAEIIVAKHNFGPRGSVELVYRNNLAKYENAFTRVVKQKE
jgi:replicative DNA helicase